MLSKYSKHLTFLILLLALLVFLVSIFLITDPLYTIVPFTGDGQLVPETLRVQKVVAFENATVSITVRNVFYLQSNISQVHLHVGRDIIEIKHVPKMEILENEEITFSVSFNPDNLLPSQSYQIAVSGEGSYTQCLSSTFKFPLEQIYTEHLNVDRVKAFSNGTVKLNVQNLGKLEAKVIKVKLLDYRGHLVEEVSLSKEIPVPVGEEVRFSVSFNMEIFSYYPRHHTFTSILNSERGGGYSSPPFSFIIN